MYTIHNNTKRSLTRFKRLSKTKDFQSVSSQSVSAHVEVPPNFQVGNDITNETTIIPIRALVATKHSAPLRRSWEYSGIFAFLQNPTSTSKFLSDYARVYPQN